MASGGWWVLGSCEWDARIAATGTAVTSHLWTVLPPLAKLNRLAIADRWAYVAGLGET